MDKQKNCNVIEDLNHINKINNPIERAQALVSLIPNLTKPELVEEVLKVALILKEQRLSRWYQVIIALAPYLTIEQFRGIFEDVESINNSTAILALDIIIPRLPTSFISELFKLTPKIHPSSRRAKLLVALIPRLSPNLLIKALNHAHKIDDIEAKKIRIYKLKSIDIQNKNMEPHSYSYAMIKAAIKEEIDRELCEAPRARAKVLALLYYYFEEEQQDKIFEELLVAIEEITAQTCKVRTLIALDSNISEKHASKITKRVISIVKEISEDIVISAKIHNEGLAFIGDELEELKQIENQLDSLSTSTPLSEIASLNHSIERYLFSQDRWWEPNMIDGVPPNFIPSPKFSLFRYPYIECPVSSPINEKFSLHVQIMIEPSESDIEKMEIEDTGVLNKLPEVEIVLRARSFEIEGSNTRIIQVERDDDTEERFVLIPRKLGEQQIRVDFYQNSSRIGTTRKNIAIHSEDNSATIEIAQPEEQPVLEFKNNFAVPPPDLELCVELDRNDKKTLYFTLHSTKSEIDYHHKRVGEVTLKSSPVEKIKSVYEELGHLAEKLSRTGMPVNLDLLETQTLNNKQRDEDRLIAVGEDLWEELIPELLKQEYWKFKDKVQSLLITSDEPWIPWEMIKPYDRDEDIEEPFWCDRFAMSRWLSGPGTAEEFPGESVVTVAPDRSNLPNVIKEVDFLQNLSSLRASILSMPTINSGLDLKNYFKKQEFSILHFACHGMFDRNLPNDSAISLTGGSFYPSDIRIKFKEPRPLIFINACHGGRVGFSFTKIGGWAEKFVNAKVGVFIGAMWEVNDELAYLFAETFYTGLLKDNLTVAEAFQKSRQVIRDAAPYNSTWLAYSLYANPEARII